MNEADRLHDLSCENHSEIFFREEARRIIETFQNIGDPDQLNYLRQHLHNMKILMCKLQQPWDKHIPLLFKGFALSMQRENTRQGWQNSYRLTTELIDSMIFLSQNKALIYNMIIFLDKQIREIDELQKHCNH